MAKKKSLESNGDTNPTSDNEVVQDGNTVVPKEPNGKRQRLSQTDVPSASIDEALRIPRAIADNYAFSPTRPLDVAAAIGMQPTSGPFRMLTGLSIAYGLTDGVLMLHSFL